MPVRSSFRPIMVKHGAMWAMHALASERDETTAAE